MKNIVIYLFGVLGLFFLLTPLTANELNIDDGYKRNYKTEKSSTNTWDSIVYSANYLKSTLNMGGTFDGSVGLTYIYNKYNGNGNERFQKNTIQEYKLGYRGVLYSPKLLNYTLSGTLRIEDVEYEYYAETSKNKIGTHEYDAKFNFLNFTKLPFTISAKKREKPLYMSLANVNNDSEYTYSSFGLSGRIDINMFKISYGATDQSEINDNFFSIADIRSRVYTTNLSRDKKNYSIKLDFTNTNQDIKREDENNNIFSFKEDEKRVNLTYQLKISDSIKLNTNSYYRTKNRENDILLSSDNSIKKNVNTLIYSNLNLLWNPKGKHRGSISMNGFSIEDKIIDINTTNYNMKSMQINQNYTYNMTESLNLSQISSYNILYSNSSIIQNIILGSNINYSKKIFKTTKINFGVSGNINNNINNDKNATSSNDSTSSTYSVVIGVNQTLQNINSNINIGLGYNGFINSEKEEYKNYKASFNMNTNIYSIMRNRFMVSYFESNSELLGSENILSSSIITRFMIEDKINYITRIGIKGTFKLNLGMRYLVTQIDEGIIDQLRPNVDVLFNYRLGSKLRYSGKCNVNKDLIYNITNYNFENTLIFKNGKVNVSMGYYYNKLTVDNKSEITDRDSHIVNVKFIRRF